MCFKNVYETRPGDTPAIIAKEQLGDRERWREVVEWNLGKCGPMGPHDWYRVWTFLRLPEGSNDLPDSKNSGAV